MDLGKLYRDRNKNVRLRRNSSGEYLVLGCNYHTTWQKHKAMRFVLHAIDGRRATMRTRSTRSKFETNIDDLIFIKSEHNRDKAIRYCPDLRAELINIQLKEK
jgi:hypothetical protein